jgi:hypothetical protein
MRKSRTATVRIHDGNHDSRNDGLGVNSLDLYTAKVYLLISPAFED